MTACLFKTILAGLCWSAASHLKVLPHLVSEWCEGEEPIAGRVAQRARAALVIRQWMEHGTN